MVFGRGRTVSVAPVVAQRSIPSIMTGMAMTPAKAGRVLGLLAKRPVPGAVKTRLASQTSPVWAAAVAEAFLRDSIERLAGIDARRVLVYTPADAEFYFAGLTNGRFDLIAQADGDLGARMERFLGGQLAAGAEAVVLVGADSPTLPTDCIIMAFAMLERADLVLG